MNCDQHAPHLGPRTGAALRGRRPRQRPRQRPQACRSRRRWRAPFPTKPRTLNLATDQPGLLLHALRKRIVIEVHLEYYAIVELKVISESMPTELNLLTCPQTPRLIAEIAGGLHPTGRCNSSRICASATGSEAWNQQRATIGIERTIGTRREIGPAHRPGSLQPSRHGHPPVCSNMRRCFQDGWSVDGYRYPDCRVTVSNFDRGRLPRDGLVLEPSIPCVGGWSACGWGFERGGQRFGPENGLRTPSEPSCPLGSTKGVG